MALTMTTLTDDKSKEMMVVTPSFAAGGAVTFPGASLTVDAAIIFEEVRFRVVACQFVLVYNDISPSLNVQTLQ
jgi:hypothetical protein